MKTFSAFKEVQGWKGVVEERPREDREPTRTRTISGYFDSEAEAIAAAVATIRSEGGDA